MKKAAAIATEEAGYRNMIVYDRYTLLERVWSEVW